MDVAVETEQMFLLTEFTYDLEKSNAQTYNVCWTQQALALLTQLGLTSHPTTEALPIHAFIASGCMVGNLTLFL